MSITVGIIDYQMGNLRSVSNAIKTVGAEPSYVSDPDELRNFDKLILPGVGAFGEAISRLRKTGLSDALNEVKRGGKAILGLCLGMQLMCSSSEEGGQHTGLEWFDAKVKRFPTGKHLKVPHIGWNNLKVAQTHALFEGIGSEPDVYFVHSYRVECSHAEDVLAWCDYGEPFAAIIGKNTIWGLQFHPEKSQRAGLAMLRNFVENQQC